MFWKKKKRKTYPDRRVHQGETFHFTTASGGRDITVALWCGDLLGRWYCVTCVEHVRLGEYSKHIKTEPHASREHGMLWDCSEHGPEARLPDRAGIRRLK